MVTVENARTCGGVVALMAAVLVVAACNSQTPLERLERQLEEFPEYSVTLQDMRADGYWHQYGVVAGQSQAGSEDLVYRDSILDFQKVGRRTYARYQPHLGMVILSKGPDGVVDKQNQHPPGYQQVGNERYGRWSDRGGGQSFWVFYGQYALLSHMIGGFNRPIYRNDWNGYRDARGRGQTYTANGVYGTNGSGTRTTNPNFFRRQDNRQAARSRSFSQRVNSRVAGGTRRFGK